MEGFPKKVLKEIRCPTCSEYLRFINAYWACPNMHGKLIGPRTLQEAIAKALGVHLGGDDRNGPLPSIYLPGQVKKVLRFLEDLEPPAT